MSKNKKECNERYWSMCSVLKKEEEEEVTMMLPNTLLFCMCFITALYQIALHLCFHYFRWSNKMNPSAYQCEHKIYVDFFSFTNVAHIFIASQRQVSKQASKLYLSVYVPYFFFAKPHSQRQRHHRLVCEQNNIIKIIFV